MAFPTTGVLSSFTGADESPISESGAWTTDPFGVGNPAMQRISNALSGSVTTGADCESGYDAASYGPDCEIHVTMGTKGPGAGAWLWLGLRGDFAAQDGYFLAWITAGGTDTQRIYRKDAGVDTQLGATNTSTFSAGDELGFEAIDDTLTVYRKPAAGAWASVFSRTDATHGGAGKLFVSADNTTVRMDDFSGGTVTPPLTSEPDVMQRNPMSYSGGPVLSPSMLVRDPDPAMRFAGGSTFTIPHSASLNLLDGAVGGIGIAFPLKIPAYPASDTLLFNKSGEYAAYILTDGTLRFELTGGSVDSSAPIPLDTDIFVELVYNGAYSGDPKVGKTTTGATSEGLYADYMAGSLTGENNVRVNRHQMLERAQLTDIVMRLVRYDNNPSFQDVAAVAFSDTSGPLPDAVLGQSEGQLLGSLTPGAQSYTLVTFTLPEPFMLDVGDYVWLGYAGGARHTSESPVMIVSGDSTGGTRKTKNATVSASSAGPASQALSAFGAAAGSDSFAMDIYADYTPLARSGDEGHLLIYLDGQEDNRAAYTDGITAGTADLTGPEFDVYMDELLLWNRAPTPVEVAQLYAAR